MTEHTAFHGFVAVQVRGTVALPAVLRKRYHLDLDAATVRVVASAGRVNGYGWLTGPPKSAASRRTLTIPAAILPDLRACSASCQPCVEASSADRVAPTAASCLALA